MINNNMLNIDNIHFIGIGGIGMSSLARILLEMGKKVSGSDAKDSPILRRLREEGANTYIGHKPENLEKAKIIVVSTAIKENNIEFMTAKELGLPIFHRSDILNFLLQRFKHSIAITGTHGKTSTTAMLSLILKEGKLNPTISIGGEVFQLDSNAELGKSDYLVAEVDESDKSLEHLSANIAIVTNIEEDHLDHYKNLDEILISVETFLLNMPIESPIILCLDDHGTRRLADMIQRKVITYSLLHPADFKGGDVKLLSNGSKFKVWHKNKFLGEFVLPIPGLHNVSNALASIACAVNLNIPVDNIFDALANYKGVKRRFQIIGDWHGITIIDDYAHHPSEIRATLMAGSIQKRPITAVFQPHRYSRTHALWKEFIQAFKSVDRVIITDIYTAGEENTYNIKAIDLAEEIAENNPDKEVYYIPTLKEVIPFLIENQKPKELIFTLGAGDITTLGPQLLNEFKQTFNEYHQDRNLSCMCTYTERHVF